MAMLEILLIKEMAVVALELYKNSKPQEFFQNIPLTLYTILRSLGPGGPVQVVSSAKKFRLARVRHLSPFNRQDNVSTASLDSKIEH